MVDKTKYPITPAVRVLREKKISFEPCLYPYEEHGGTRRAAEQLGVDEHAVIKTLVMETDTRQPLLLLMHGDCEVSTRNFARAIGARSVQPCDAARAQKQTGYMVGGISPFGTRAAMPVYVEKTIFDLPKIYINGGKRGFLVALDPRDLRAVLPALEEMEAAIGDCGDHTHA